MCIVWSGTKEVKRKTHAYKPAAILEILLLERDWKKIKLPLIFHAGEKKTSSSLVIEQLAIGNGT